MLSDPPSEQGALKKCYKYYCKLSCQVEKPFASDKKELDLQMNYGDTIEYKVGFASSVQGGGYEFASKSLEWTKFVIPAAGSTPAN